MRSARTGFTMIDTVAAAVVVALAGAVAAVHCGAQPDSELAKARRTSRRLKDATHLRGIGQALITFAQNNADRYPLPSRLDQANATVREEGAAKDTSGNVMSILIYSGFLPTDMLISPVEVNTRIAEYASYEFDRPKAAADPANALWDPAFSADFTGGKTGGLSYAHLPPSGDRVKRWSNTFVASEGVVGTRGPEITSVTRKDDGSTVPVFANEQSNTFNMFEPRGDRPAAWSGHTAFNDNHVDFQSRALSPGTSIPFDPEGRNYKDAKGEARTDIRFYDEPDDPKSVNDYLSIFVRAGKTPADFKAIWD